MDITVKLFASFRTGRFDMKAMQYPAGTTVSDVAQSLSLSLTDVGIILCNHRHVKPEHELLEGDTLALFPLLGGG